MHEDDHQQPADDALYDYQDRYHAVRDVDIMPDESVEQLFDSIDNEERVSWQRVFRRERNRRGIASDRAELQLLDQLLLARDQKGVVPVGDQWVDISAPMQQSFVEGGPTQDVEELDDEDDDSGAGGLPQWVLAIGAVVGLLIVGRIGLVVIGSLSDSDSERVAQGTPAATITPQPSATPTLTPTPTVTPIPTATGIPLVNPDDPILAGDAADSDEGYFPVLLQVIPPDGETSAFVVQEVAVDVAEWNYSPNPSVASWISGMIVRPVLGIPVSQGNRELIEQIDEGTRFRVTMNTGNVLRYTFERRYPVDRTNTSVFAQFEPGMVLTLLGETQPDSDLPTRERTIIQADYSIEQETERFRSQAAPLIDMHTPVTVADETEIQVIDARIENSTNLPPGIGYALVNMQITTGRSPVDVSQIAVSLVDRPGDRYSMDATASQTGTCEPLPQSLPPNTSGCYTTGFITSQFIEQARLHLNPPDDSSDEAYVTLSFTEGTSIASRGLLVDVESMRFNPNRLFVNVRIFNPTTRPVEIDGTQIYTVFGFSKPPVGPRINPTAFEIETIEAGQAEDFRLAFYRRDEPYARINLYGFEYLVTIQPPRQAQN